MSRKKINIILILTVSFIWGLLLYRYTSPYFNKNQDIPVTKDPILITPQQMPTKDTINIFIPKRDPFLSGLTYKRKITQSQVKTKVKKKETTPKKIAIWPKIEYLGFVKSKKSKSPLGLLRIDGKLHRVTEKSNVRGLKVKSIDKLKIVLWNQNQERDFKKK